MFRYQGPLPGRGTGFIHSFQARLICTRGACRYTRTVSSFHPSGHKPTIVKRAPAGFKEQLPVIGFGALLIIGGVYRQMHGVFVQPNWYFQPIYSSGMIVAGSVIVLIGLIPIPLS